MNSTISLKPGDYAYVPFWVLLEFLDATPPQPFLKVKIINIGERHVDGPGGPIDFMAVDLEIKPDLVASGLPYDYLIPLDQINVWAVNISNWFLQFKGE